MVYLLLPNTGLHFCSFYQLLNPIVSIVQGENQTNQFPSSFNSCESWILRGQGHTCASAPGPAKYPNQEGLSLPVQNSFCYLKIQGSPSTCAHSTSDRLNTQLTGRILSQIFLREVPFSKVIYSFEGSLHCYLFTKPQTCMYLKDIFANRLHSALSDWK